MRVLVGDLEVPWGVAMLPDGSALVGQRRTGEVVLVAPPTLLPVGVAGWPVTVSHDLDAELPAADAVLMLRVQAERLAQRVNLYLALGGGFDAPVVESLAAQ